MRVLAQFLLFVGGLMALVGFYLGVPWILHGSIVFGALACGFGALGLLVVREGWSRLGGASGRDEQGFEQTIKQLGAKGPFTLDQAAMATSLGKDDVNKKLRTLVGRGVCEMDFTADGT